MHSGRGSVVIFGTNSDCHGATAVVNLIVIGVAGRHLDTRAIARAKSCGRTARMTRNLKVRAR